MYNYNKAQDFRYDHTKFAIHSILRSENDLISKCGLNFKKTFSFHDIVHFIDEESIVTYIDFVCGNISCLEAPTKVEHINRKRKNVFRSCKKPKCNPSNNQHNCSIFERNTSNIFPKTYSL